MSSEPALDPSIRERVLAAARTPSPTREAVVRRGAAIMSVFVALALAVFFFAGGVREWGAPRPASLIAATVTGFAGCAGLASYFAFSRGGRVIGRPLHQLWGIILVTPLALFAWKVLWSSLYAGGLDEWPSRFGNKCLGLVLVMGALITVGGVLSSRSERARPGLSGAAMGMGGAALATVLVELWCPVGHPFHVFYGHILPTLIICLLGAGIATRVARPGR